MSKSNNTAPSGDASAAQDRRNDEQHVTTYSWAGVAVGGVLIVIGAIAAGSGLWAVFLATHVAIAAGTVMIGGFLGVLFSIPRIGAGRGSSDAAATDDGASANGNGGWKSNTNLEEISDWLTKILLGVGLTQIAVLPSYLWSKSQLIGGLIAPVTWIPVSVLGTVVYFTILGFLAGYFLMRIRVTPALARATNATNEITASDRQTVADTAEAAVGTDDKQEATPEAVASATKIINQPVEKLTSAKDWADRAQAALVLGQKDDAATAFQKAIDLGTNDPKILRNYAMTLWGKGERQKSLSFTEAASALANVQGDTRTHAVAGLDMVLRDLYKPAPEGFQAARNRANGMGTLTRRKDEARRQFYLVCAAGQAARYAKKKGNDADYETERAAAIQAIDEVLRLDDSDHRWSQMMAWIWDRNAASFSPNEDDLTVFFDNDDPDIRERLAPFSN